MSQLKQLIQEVNQAPTIRDAVIIAQDRWAKNYQIVTGNKDGHQRFETELLNYLDIVAEKPELSKITDKFQHFGAVMKAATTGLSFKSDGHLYPTVIGGKIKIQIGAHGKKEMLRQMKEVKFVGEPQVVMKGDEFVYDKLNSKIIKHVSTDKSSTRNNLEDVVASYVRLEYHDGRIVDVVMYHEELKKAKASSRNQGANSVWENWPLEMAKKVPLHRAKKQYHRFPEGIELNLNNEISRDGEETTDVPYQEAAEVTEPATSEEQPQYAAAEKDTEAFM